MVRSPIRSAVRITLRAISPRLATSRESNMVSEPSALDAVEDAPGCQRALWGVPDSGRRDIPPIRSSVRERRVAVESARLQAPPRRLQLFLGQPHRIAA